jgi:serine/threonine protein phosphatase PrpC
MLRVAEQYAGTDTGLQRRANEDSLLARAPLFVVADGMGGAQAGEVASRIAVETFHDGLAPGEPPERGLVAYAHAANARIYALSRANAEQAGMGTTLTAMYVGEDEVAIAHVGDSRAYCLRDEELLRLTDDHSLVDELIREGRLTPEEAEEHPQRSIITRALGPEEAVEVDTRTFRGRGGDLYLLCSDGLTSMVHEARVAELLRAHAHGRLRDAGEALIAEANRAGGRDNITVILLRLEEVAWPTGAAPAGAPDGEGAYGEDDYITIAGMPAAPPPVPPSAAPPPAAAPPPVAPPPAGGPPLASGAESTVFMPAAVGVEGNGRGDGTPVVARRPRPPARTPPPARRRLRRVLPALVVAAVLGALVAGGYVASRSVYFLGTDARGLVTMYRGLPYSLPGGVNLYTRYYVSGVGASTLSPVRQHELLDHTLRSEADAASLVRSLEREELSE